MQYQCKSCNCINQIESDYLGDLILCGGCEMPMEIPADPMSAGFIVGGDFVVAGPQLVDDTNVYPGVQISLQQRVWIHVLAATNDSETIHAFITSIQLRAGTPRWHPRPRAVGQDDNGDFYQVYECYNPQSAAEVNAITGSGPSLSSVPPDAD